MLSFGRKTFIEDKVIFASYFVVIHIQRRSV